MKFNLVFIAIVIHSAIAWGASPLQDTPRQPTGVIAGRIIDDGGRPMRRVQVQAFVASYRQGRRDMEPRGNTATTNDRGEFRLFRLEPGAYYIIANPIPPLDFGSPQTTTRPPVYLPSSPDSTFVMTYFPGTWESSKAEPVQVGRGEIDVRTIQMAALPTRIIRLSLENPKVAPNRIYGVQAALRSEADPSMMTFANAPRQIAPNEFETQIGLVSGPYQMIVTALTWDGTLMGSKTFFVDSVEPERLVVPVSPVMAVEGQVAGGRNRDSLRLIAVPAPHLSSGIPAWTSVRSNGRFVLEVLPGTYALTVEGLENDDYLNGVEFQGKNTSSSLIEFLPDAESLSLKLNISNDGGRVAGVVLDGDRPRAGAAIVLAPVEDSGTQGHSTRFTVTDLQGEFEIRGVAPGRYVAVAFDDPQWERLRDPVFLKSLAAEGTAFTVESGSRQDLRLLRLPKQ